MYFDRGIGTAALGGRVEGHRNIDVAVLPQVRREVGVRRARDPAGRGDNEYQGGRQARSHWVLFGSAPAAGDAG
jgi:hypothetical protein